MYPNRLKEVGGVALLGDPFINTEELWRRCLATNPTTTELARLLVRFRGKQGWQIKIWMAITERRPTLIDLVFLFFSAPAFIRCRAEKMIRGLLPSLPNEQAQREMSVALANSIFLGGNQGAASRCLVRGWVGFLDQGPGRFEELVATSLEGKKPFMDEARLILKTVLLWLGYEEVA